MPRTARIKSKESKYHIMSRSISEKNLFQCDEDKSYYLSLLKKYSEMFNCKIYAYCLMDNHVHFYIDPCLYDISSFMLCLNSAYVSYFNLKYNRHGVLFQGRFASTIVDNITYSLTLSAYIHNNAKNLPGYEGREEMYQYSSYGIYTGRRRNDDKLIDTEFLLKLFSEDSDIAKEKYRTFTVSMKDNGIMKEVDDNILRDYTKNEYKNYKQYVTRYQKPEILLSKISEVLEVELTATVRTKHYRKTSKDRAFVTYTMRTLCGFTYKIICQYIGNMSMSGISRLSSKGFKLLSSESRYLNAFNSLIQVQL